MKYAFILGRNPELSLAELGAIFGASLRTQPAAGRSNLVFFDGELPQNPQDFLNCLGGCVEILEIFEDAISPSALETAIVNFLKNKSGKITFALNLIPENKKSRLLKFLLPRVKKSLRQTGRSAAFLNKNFLNASPVAAVKQNLVERGANISVIELGEGKVSLGYSAAMQDFEAYSKRDYGKPFRDPASGMLPPKLAQILINLACHVEPVEARQAFTIVDPFCGTGTILMEAMLMGYSVIGSDKDARFVEGTKKNIDWLRQIFPSRVPARTHAQLFQKDATTHERSERAFIKRLKHEGANQSGSLALAVITEPYLGPPLSQFPAENFLQKLMAELSALYINFFKNLATWISKGAVVVIIFPYWRKSKSADVKLSEKISAAIEKLGFNKTIFHPLAAQSLFYERPDRVVGREIIRFIYKVSS